MKNVDNKIVATQISLPKGGGSIQGIGEIFQSNEFTGTASLSIPIPTSPCRGFEPNLTIEYNSGFGNGAFGLGFNLSIPNVSRKTAKGIPKYDDSDTFLLSNFEDLVLIDENPSDKSENGEVYKIRSYSPRVEGAFAKIEHWTNQSTKDSHWKITNKENITSIFGKSENARILNPDNPTQVFQWLLEETFDARGNHIIYEYKQENTDNVPAALYEQNRAQTANKYIERIRYGNDKPLQAEITGEIVWHFEVVFDYGEYDITPQNPTPYAPVQSWKSRRDSFSGYSAGFEIRTHRLCRNILMFHHFPDEFGDEPILTHATQFNYRESSSLSLLASVESIGYRYQTNELYQIKKMPPLEFGYIDFQPAGHTFELLLQENGQDLPGMENAPNYMLIDLYGEGIPGIFYSDGETVLYWQPEIAGNDQNIAGKNIRYAPPQTPFTFPIIRNFETAECRLIDLSGNGRINLVVNTPSLNGYFECEPERNWQNFHPFESFPTDFLNADHQMVDVTGDGLADILSLDKERAIVYRSRGRKGFDSSFAQNHENDIPLPKKGELREAFRFADIFGTGTRHLLRIADGTVECYPNLGYGRFGEKVLLENAPRFNEQMDASRLFLVDVDGSGTADLVYVYSDRIEIFFNLSGNSFSEPLSIALPGAWDDLNQINFADIYGNGVNCLVFSENHPAPRHWVYDFSQRRKAYLLNEINNNLGAKKRITYCSSTEFYLEDRKKGNDWITSLPFPVQVVKRLDSFDLISGSTLTSNYAYHHGYYDEVEREFRGFGLVERQDAEIPETFLTSAARDDETFFVPPVLTKTWYHTGFWHPDGTLPRQSEKEYFSGDRQARHLPDSRFAYSQNQPDGAAFREAHRALKGTVLRTEVYGLDGSVKEKNPYAASENNYVVKQLQEKGKNRHGIYFVHPCETLGYEYERSADDPRIHHQFILKVDDYGNTLRSCQVAYGRRQSNGQEFPEQFGLKVTLTDSRFINRDEDEVRLLGSPQENKVCEIKNASPAPGERYFSFEDISNYIDKALATDAARLMSQQRYRYWSPADNNAYPAGQVSPQALLYQVEEAAFSAEHIEGAFEGALTKSKLDDLLSGEGGYRQDAEKTFWWNPGLAASYFGSERFYLPKTTADAFGNTTKYEYDEYRLLPISVTDALNNQTIIQKIDYQTLKPRQIRDANRNISEVLFDAFGVVIAGSFYGNEGNSSAGFVPLENYRLQEDEGVDAVIANPGRYLQGASSFFYYDFFSWMNRQTPVHAVNLIAENYPSAQVRRTQIHITYTDGFGREHQNLTKVEPGPAFKINSDETVTIYSTDNRWLSSGRAVYDNKGNKVKEYEPFFIDGHAYVDNPLLNSFGVSSVLKYDPCNRVVRIDTPKGFFSKIEFTAWEEMHYDENDTIRDSSYFKENINNQSPEFQFERQALQKASLFYDTPEERILDNLGRSFLIVQNNAGNRLKTHYELDIQGNKLSSADPRLYPAGKKNFTTVYSMAGAPLKTISADAGTHWVLKNAYDNLIYCKDERKVEAFTKYDALHRPTEIYIQGGDAETSLNQIVERMIYGDSPGVAADPENENLRGRLYIHYDQAGATQISRYDIQGKPLEGSRRLNQNYKQEANWNDISTNALHGMLQATVYKTAYQYDALGRVTAETKPDGSVYEPSYQLPGWLNQIQMRPRADEIAEIYVQSIEYNAKGQRTEIIYGNGVKAKYEYEKTTLRLVRILTERVADNKILQDLSYTYDAVGNVTHISDAAFSTVFNNNQQIEPESDYTYDALYRLIQSSGRQHEAMSAQNERKGDFDESRFLSLSRANTNNQQQMQNYTRLFSYDDGGNLYQIKHQSAAGSWTKNLTVSDSSNRAVEIESLDLTTAQPVSPAEQIDRFFDANGNQKRLSGVNAIAWNYRNNIAKATIIDRDNAPSDAEYYVYDSGGNRIRKITERFSNGGNGVRTEETIYLGTLEIKLISQGNTVVEERRLARVMDDRDCVAIRLAWTRGAPPKGVSNPQIRYQLDNLSGSSQMEIDRQGQIISYEEYFAFGGTSLVAGRSLSEVKLKQYRYSGKERDALTGLYYYGARYYAPWLGRWMSPDPAGTIDGLNLFLFVGNNPLNYNDIGGYGRAKNQRKARKIRKVKQSAKLSSPPATLQRREKFYAKRNTKTGEWRLKGRPDFDSAAKRIDLGDGGKDRRHVVGFADQIKPAYEAVINIIISQIGEDNFKKLQVRMYEEFKVTRAPSESNSIEKHLTFGLTKLNSATGNLNAENAVENQAIETVRGQAVAAIEGINSLFEQDASASPTLADLKNIAKESLSISGEGTPRTDFADGIRRFSHQRIDSAEDELELIHVLWEIKASTGIDLNKEPGKKKDGTPGSSEQTAFALNYINEVRNASDPSYQMTHEARLRTVWNLRNMPEFR